MSFEWVGYGVGCGRFDNFVIHAELKCQFPFIELALFFESQRMHIFAITDLQHIQPAFPDLSQRYNRHPEHLPTTVYFPTIQVIAFECQQAFAPFTLSNKCLTLFVASRYDLFFASHCQKLHQSHELRQNILRNEKVDGVHWCCDLLFRRKRDHEWEGSQQGQSLMFAIVDYHSKIGGDELAHGLFVAKWNCIKAHGP